MNYYSTDYDAFLKEELQKLESEKKKQQDAINQVNDSNAKILKEQYGAAIDDAAMAYDSEYQRNAVQKLINEKQIAEKNANLGLTDSGLNRTQQTATQLNYANQKGSIDLARQKTIDTLSQNLVSALTNLEQKRTINLAEVDSSIDAQARSNALSRYNTNVEANAKMYEAQQEALSKQSATIDEFNKINDKIEETLKKYSFKSWSKPKESNRKKALELIQSYYLGGLINELQAQELIRKYNLEDYILTEKENGW